MCNRCSNWSNGNYEGGMNRFSNNWGSPRNLTGCRNALQQLSDEAARAAAMVEFIQNNECPFNNGCQPCGCNCGCHCGCRCGCRCRYRCPRY